MPGLFPSTHWSQIAALETADPARRRELLDGLARRYWRPACEYLRVRQGLPLADAEDLTQQFFTTLLARGDFDRLDRERGSLRAFLKTSLANFASTARKAARARPSLTDGTSPALDRAGPHPDELFDRAWALEVLRQAADRIKAELQQEGRSLELALFEQYCFPAEDRPTYKELAAQHGLDENEVRWRLRDARTRARFAVRKIVRDYLGPGADIDEELRFLLAP